MDFEWVAIALGDVVWISVAFVLGMGARLIGLPPMVGFLVAGFVLHALGAAPGTTLQALSDLGITLLLFSIGLKLNMKTLMRPQVWAVTTAHTLLTVLVFGVILFGFASTGLALFDSITWPVAFMLAFALSFSSTVFVVKVLEERGETASLHGRIAIGILVMQDLAAVVFLAVSSGKVPTPWAFALFALIPLRPLLYLMLKKMGHGELQVLLGLILALGGAKVFEMVGIKADLGALILGAMLAGSPRASELARSMLGFKDLFLVGFFLTIGLSGQPSYETVLTALILALLVGFKSALFYFLLTWSRLRARTSLLATLSLSNYSEFGLIVAAIGVSSGWLSNEWLVTIAIALSFTFVFASVLNARGHEIYFSRHETWNRFQHARRLPDDPLLDTGEATIAVFGMGRVGTGAYDKMREIHGDTVVGVDFDEENVRVHQAAGRKVLLGDPTDADFWDRVNQTHRIRLVMLALPNRRANLNITQRLRQQGFPGGITATVKYQDDIELLEAAGADAAYNIYAEAGIGFAEHVAARWEQTSPEGKP
ncbi:MAG: cation:proton antiporter [Gammaproteobacteria bacterium]|nr:cation:proton antiporter [Gammaproteobacteria bacterium]